MHRNNTGRRNIYGTRVLQIQAYQVKCKETEKQKLIRYLLIHALITKWKEVIQYDY